MIDKDNISRIQDQLGKLAIDALRIDLDGFLEASDLIGSPQALGAGASPKAVASAGGWAEMARLLQPFRDHVVARTRALREEIADEADLVVEWAACPSCSERHIDALIIQADESVVCSTCRRRYSPTREAGDA